MNTTSRRHKKSTKKKATGGGKAGEVIMLRGLYIRTKMLDEYGAKRQIAIHVASKYVKDFDAVLLDAGSTAEMIAEEMFARRKFLSVLTNNMGAYAAYTRARELMAAHARNEEDPPNRGNELLITGGRYVDVYESLLGAGASASIKDFIPNIIIIGTSGLRSEEGVFCHGSEESAVKELLWTKPTDLRLIATDWTKIGKRDAHAFGPLENLRLNAKQAVVVTCEPPKEMYEEAPAVMQAFENQIKKMEKSNILVERIPVLDLPFPEPVALPL